MVYVLEDGHEVTKFESFVLQHLQVSGYLKKSVKEGDILEYFKLKKADKSLKKRAKDEIRYVVELSPDLVEQKGKDYSLTKKGTDITDRLLASEYYPRVDGYRVSDLSDYL